MCFGFRTKRFTGISAHQLIDTRRGYLIRLPFAFCFSSFPNFSSIPHSPASFISLKPSGMTEHTSTAVQIFVSPRKAEERGEEIGLDGCSMKGVHPSCVHFPEDSHAWVQTAVRTFCDSMR